MSRNIYDAPVLYESLGFVIAWRPIQNFQSTIERYLCVYDQKTHNTHNITINASCMRIGTLSMFYSDFSNLILPYNITL